MKLLTIPFASAFFIAMTACPAMADAPQELELTDAVILNKLPSLKEEEMKRVPFAAQMRTGSAPRQMDYEIHNPFRDREFLGVVVTVTLSDGPEGKPISFDVFIRVDVPPLRMTRNGEAIFSGLGSDKASMTIVLKEIHYKTEAS